VETGDLPRWAEVAGYADWTGLLVGNGGSVAIWPPFAYGSLYEIATSEHVDHPLTDSDRELFGALRTENFEQVLASLKIAGLVADALGEDTTALEERYESVQRALFEAVHGVHVPWVEVAEEIIPRIHEILREYRVVFSTNYDLVLYWASMDNGGAGFLDYFWGAGNSFDTFDTEIWATRKRWTRLLFLHGGIHLRRLPGGGTRKATSSEGALLDQFGVDYDEPESPLLISEGQSADKLASIRSSDYLSFAHQMFAAHEGGLVVFGHSLSEQDDHLITPMSRWSDTPVAVSLLPREREEDVIQAKQRIRGRLAPMQDIVFFDATSHPLGGPDLGAGDA
jgi:hypothetical protein